MGRGIENIKPFHNKWIEQLTEKDKEPIKSLLKRIFPKLETVFGGSTYGASWESTWRKELRICSPEVFPVYFRLAIPEGQISYMEMQSILALAKNGEAFGNKLLELSRQHRADGLTRVSAFLERMEDYTEKEIPKEHIPEILRALFDVGDELLVPEDEGRGLFSWGNDVRIGRIMFQLLKRYITQEERFKVLREVFSKGGAVSMIVNEVASLGQQHGKYGGQTKPDSECLISAQYVEELEKIALKKIQELTSQGKLLSVPGLAHILYRWRDWEGEASVRKWATQVTVPDKGLVEFLTGFLSKGYSHTITNRVERIQWRLDPKSLEPFINPSEIIDRCKTILNSSPNWLKDEKKIAVETFIKWYTLRKDGKNPENYWEEEEQ